MWLPEWLGPAVSLPLGDRWLRTQSRWLGSAAGAVQLHFEILQDLH
jgi:hypothetical protein